jgi:uncharacterized glyoxalase superfamily protein PhnB
MPVLQSKPVFSAQSDEKLLIRRPHHFPLNYLLTLSYLTLSARLIRSYEKTIYLVCPQSTKRPERVFLDLGGHTRQSNVTLLHDASSDESFSTSTISRCTSNRKKIHSTLILQSFYIPVILGLQLWHRVIEIGGEDMKRKIAIVGSILLVLIVLTAWTVPAFAADPSGASQPSTQSTQQGNKVWVMRHLLLVQDEAKVDAFIANAQDTGKITAEQAAKIKEFWTNHHEQFAKRVILGRLLLVQDEAKVDAFIANAQNAGKITAEQATKIKEFWTNHHEQFAKRVMLARLLRAKDGAKVQAFLDKAIAAGKIQREQADKIMILWNELHSK